MCYNILDEGSSTRQAMVETTRPQEWQFFRRTSIGLSAPLVWPVLAQVGCIR